ncbi:orotidine-5'-phosphate decarboxylase [Gracilimonas mengyeensis]|uniref:Orotidine-5'-phosphate decarboxylase n=1 Tax=Gracilimonas mengyeensis TaxID=1302730 RepID=A0A521E2C6_9BACT|nr:orotidine-5'-phosphate decarboxylase [Gracilimonas mengyeensis]SMO77975.1 orotidine-5'-phosphate decarboxylase [Gracilimonas mengyeensis]
MIYNQKLQQAVAAAKSTLCVGLDPNLDLLPKPVKQQFETPEEKVSHFCKLVIDYTAPYCAAFKPNLAFFEALGANGFQVLQEVIDHIPEDKIVIADAKRGDISSTAEHYKKSFWDEFEVDAVTLNPLMGFETLDAFKKDETKGIYVLALTSNRGAEDFLKKPFAGFPTMAQYIAHQLSEKAKDSKAHLGMVIGATQAEEARPVLNEYEQGSLLIPGVGAQGGSVAELAKALKTHKGIPLINSSRGIIYAGSDEGDWPEHVADAAKKMKHQLNTITASYV